MTVVCSLNRLQWNECDYPILHYSIPIDLLLSLYRCLAYPVLGRRCIHNLSHWALEIRVDYSLNSCQALLCGPPHIQPPYPKVVDAMTAKGHSIDSTLFVSEDLASLQDLLRYNGPLHTTGSVTGLLVSVVVLCEGPTIVVQP